MSPVTAAAESGDNDRKCYVSIGVPCVVYCRPGDGSCPINCEPWTLPLQCSQVEASEENAIVIAHYRQDMCVSWLSYTVNVQAHSMWSKATAGSNDIHRSCRNSTRIISKHYISSLDQLRQRLELFRPSFEIYLLYEQIHYYIYIYFLVKSFTRCCK